MPSATPLKPRWAPLAAVRPHVDEVMPPPLEATERLEEDLPQLDDVERTAMWLRISFGLETA